MLKKRMHWKLNGSASQLFLDKRSEQRFIMSVQRKSGEIRGQVIPLLEQVMPLAMLPIGVGSNLLRQLLFWGFRGVPRTVHAVRCAWGGSASGAHCMGVRRGLSMMMGVVWLRMFQNAGKWVGWKSLSEKRKAIIRPAKLISFFIGSLPYRPAATLRSIFSLHRDNLSI